MIEEKIAAVVLAAGQGTRMKNSCPKVLNTVVGIPMIARLISTISKIGVEKVVVIGSEDNRDVLVKAVAPHDVTVQKEQKGTADAVLTAKPLLEDWDGDVLVLFGDTPLITAETIEKMFEKKAAEKADIVLLAFNKEEENRYGHIICSDAGVERIVEFKDASLAEKQIKTCFSGLMCVSGNKIWQWLDKIGNNNAAGEYYLTDIVKIAKAEKAKISLFLGDEREFLGINTLEELAYAEEVVQKYKRKQFMDNGVTLRAPDTVFFSYDTEIGKDVVIEPNVYFGKGVKIGDNVTIKAFSYIEGATIESGAVIGPFARLRPEAEIGQDAHIGNFVEIKKSKVGKGSKVNHLTYIGDADIGEKVNVGAGTITCNYDGYDKFRTEIGDGAFIGSNTSLVAPVKVGDGAIVGASSCITEDVPEDALAVARGTQHNKKEWAAKYREHKEK